MQPKSVAETATKTGSAPWSPSDLIDLERYPILDLSAATARDLTAHCREQLDKTGACELPGFLKPDSVELLVRESDSLAPLAYHSVVTGTPYLAVPDPSLPNDHPRKFFEPTSVGVVAYDQFPDRSLLRPLFELYALMEFIA